MQKQHPSKANQKPKQNNQSRDRDQRKDQKEQRIVHKGIYISNERRKGPGGRIKCDTFEGKIQVMDTNAAIHESEVQWVEIRRYIRGEKRQDRNGRNKGQFNDKDKNNKSKTGKKYVQVKKDQKDQKQTKTIVGEQQKTKPTNINNSKQAQVQTNNKPTSSAHPQVSSPTLTPSEISVSTTVKQEVKKSRKNNNEEKKHQDNDDNQANDEVETESEHDNDEERGEQDGVEVVRKQQTVVVLKKSLENDPKASTQKQGETQKPVEKRQQVIVARIVKQTKIIYKQKKFVAILTCQKKKTSKSTFIQKDIQPITKICQDYFLDVTPIHSRLPKMQLDSLVPQNIKVLNEYIEKTYPQKGKELTKKKLNQILDVIESIYVVVSFGLWEGRQPFANIHQVIGKTMTIDGECNCFLFEHHLNDFNYDLEDIEKEKLKVLELKPTEHHKQLEIMIFTIDPATSIDLDDALSIQKIGEELFQVGIHISDVSEYLKYIQRSQLIKRTTSVYLPHKVYHMLTPELMKISSLNPNVTRLAFSIYVKMNLNGQIVEESRLEKSIMKSRFKLSYQTAQDIITAKINFDQFLKKHPNTTVQEFDTLVQKIQNLTKIGLAHRQKRIKFEVFENTEIHFELDQDRWPIDISVESRYTSKKIVEEYMIIGNVEAASHLIKHFKENALIIYHPSPSQLAIKSFNETFKFLGKTFVFNDIHQVQNQFLAIQDDEQITEEIKQYMYFKGRRMQQSAGYMLYHDAVKQIKQRDGSTGDDDVKLKNVHFALGQDFYTHFTSPMRRMADVLVHETLNSIIYKTQPKVISPQQIQKINQGRKHTKRLKRDLTEMYICLMIHKTGKCIQEDGIVTSFGLKSVSIYIPYFDMMKEIIWRDELDIHKVSKNRQDEQLLDVCIYYDRQSSARDIMWKVKKYDKVKLTIDCTKRPPLRMSISLEVTTTKGKKELIKAYNPQN